MVAMLVMEGGGGVLATARLVMGEGELLRLMITGWSVMMNRSLLSQGEGNFKPSPGYAGVSLSLAKTELNASYNTRFQLTRLPGSRNDSFRFNPILFNF